MSSPVTIERLNAAIRIIAFGMDFHKEPKARPILERLVEARFIVANGFAKLPSF